MEKILLKAEIREDLGKIGAKHLRKSGIIPAVIYKDGSQGVNVQVDGNDLWHVLHTEAGENVIITVDITGGKGHPSKTVIVKEIQSDPINEKFIHVDLQEISLKEKLKVKVPVAVKGEAVGVREDEGVLGQIMWELEVECLPTAIPENISVSVDQMRIGDAVHVKDITAPEGVELLDDPEQVIVTVNPPHEEEEEEVAEEGAEEGEEEPEVIKKGKKEEEEGAEEEQAEQPAEGGGEEK